MIEQEPNTEAVETENDDEDEKEQSMLKATVIGSLMTLSVSALSFYLLKSRQ